MNSIIKNQNKIFSNLVGIVYLSYLDVYENKNLLHIGAYRQTMQEAATFFKLSSIFNCESAIEALAIDCLENEFRFTILYNIQSIIGNINVRIITKSADGLALISLQHIYPGFNWSEREI